MDPLRLPLPLCLLNALDLCENTSLSIIPLLVFYFNLWARSPSSIICPVEVCCDSNDSSNFSKLSVFSLYRPPLPPLARMIPVPRCCEFLTNQLESVNIWRFRRQLFRQWKSSSLYWSSICGDKFNSLWLSLPLRCLATIKFITGSTIMIVRTM